MPTEITITPQDIRADFPEFADTEKYSDALIGACIRRMRWFIPTSVTDADMLAGKRRALCEYMTCHLLAMTIAKLSAESSGETSSVPGQVASASVGGVSVSIATPDNATATKYWLNQTPYGQEYLALLSMLTFPVYLSRGSKQDVL